VSRSNPLIAMNSFVRVAAIFQFVFACALACSSGGSGTKPQTTCQADSECSTGHCDPKSGCVACVFDSHCGKGQRCSGGSCYEPAPCDSDKDCKTGDFKVCDPASHGCVRCLTDSQCGDSAHCLDGACLPYAKCSVEKDCQNGTHCDLGSGECVNCLSKGDCKAGSDCVLGECHLACKVEEDCSAAGQHCTSTGHCDECANDSQCPDVYHCESGSCVRDVCEQGKSSCSADSASVATCSANGDSVQMSACASGQSCLVASGAAPCQPWICEPGSDRCSGDGASVEHCAADGLSIEKQEPCADGERCAAGRCVTQTCEPNSLYCEDGASYACSFDGTQATLLRKCEQNERCDPGTGKCVIETCQSGQTVCRDHDLGTCRDDGLGYDYAPCKAGQTCADGECKDQVCAPLTTYCDGKDVRSCNATGTDSQVTQTCSGTCVTTGISASCKVLDCTAGAPVCDGKLATACKQDGSGPEPGGVDCESLGGYCDGGICKPNVCTPSQRLCKGEYIYQCSADGRSMSSYSSYACTSYYWNYKHCNPATGNCETSKCTPEASYCSNNVAYSCDSTGFAPTVIEDCTASKKVCSAGKCVPKLCDPGYVCKDGSIYYCSSGTSMSLYTSCAASQYCSPGVSYCLQDVCQPGQPICNGNALSTCKSDGSGPADAGKACGANKVCVTDSCQDLTCTANAKFCQNGHVQQCNSTGTGSTLNQYCVSETYCDAATATCKPDVCDNGRPYCDGETLRTCKSDGSGAADAGTVCSASSKVCSLSGCATTAVDVLGSAGSTFSSPASDRIYGDIIKVAQKRKLTKVEADVAVQTGPASAHWLLYSSPDGVTFYQVSDTPASLPTMADAWVSSGALKLTLEAGLYYWVGLELPGTGSAVVTLHTADAPSTSFISFAQVLGSSTEQTSGTPANISPTTSESLYSFRLSTTLP